MQVPLQAFCDVYLLPWSSFLVVFFSYELSSFILFYLQWEHKVEKGEEDFGKISKLIQKEIARFEVR